MDTPRPPKLAVLIDAENIPASSLEELFQKIEAIGNSAVRRAYGDFSDPCRKPWAELVAKHAITPRQTFPGTNSADIALVIDAMDLLQSDQFNALCIASSDSDFTHLAIRAREQGVDVYGFGASHAAKAFKAACTRFQVLAPAPAKASQPVQIPKPAPAQKPVQAAKQVEVQASLTPAATDANADACVRILEDILKQMGADARPSLGQLGSEARKNEIYKTKMKGQLSKLLSKRTQFEVKDGAVRLRRA